ncbi:MAG: hypothetical protein WCS52_18490 [bacterium]
MKFSSEGASRRAPLLMGIFLLALLVNAALGLKFGLNKPMVSDAQLYLQIAQSVADGDGYRLREGFWPDAPTMSRAPGWPFLVSVALQVMRGIAPDLLMRCLNLLLNSLVAVLVAMLAMRVIGYGLSVIGVKPQAFSLANNGGPTTPTWFNACGLVAALLYIFYPVALYEAYEGMSEILFLALALSGTILLLGQWDRRLISDRLKASPSLPSAATHVYTTHASQSNNSVALMWSDVCGLMSLFSGFLLLGLSCLVRPSFILWIGFVGVIVIGYWLWVIGRKMKNFILSWPVVCSLLSGVFCVVLFLAPSFLWAVRNYHVCKHFPVLSTLRGQTFYGGNNPVVAGTREYWGYWVFPNNIPGEKTMYELSRTKSEYEVDAYYFEKGKTFVKEHWRNMPLLLLGKIVRAYVPVPWKFSWAAMMVAVFRCGLYILAGLGLWFLWGKLDVYFKIILTAIIATNLALVLTFYGYNRFAFEVDPFLIPFAGASLCLLVRKDT